MSLNNDIIVAPATAQGGAIAIVRASGEGCIALCDNVFQGRKPLTESKSHTIHYGKIVREDWVIDDVLISIFRAPNSYTGEEAFEISCHGSEFIVTEIIKLLIEKGARMAEHGEFTQRAYLSGRMDLSQAEAVVDTIASTSKAQHTMASTQIRGGYSDRLSMLREELISLLALLELELDFSEEDVEFASRSALNDTINKLKVEITRLIDSFTTGNAIKQGVNVAIVGAPNAGKSTLLNRLLGEQRAMVSDIAGTTRDLIEEQIQIDGVTFRFIDTAGLHDTEDTLEKMGIERTHQAIDRAQIVLQIIDATSSDAETIELKDNQNKILVINKIDISNSIKPTIEDHQTPIVEISAKEGKGINNLLKTLRAQVQTEELFKGAPIVSNLRHFDLLGRALNALNAAQSAIEMQLPTDLLCEDLRQTQHEIGEITGAEINANTILHKIFSTFCIGK